jgi:hypothetical protein
MKIPLKDVPPHYVRRIAEKKGKSRGKCPHVKRGAKYNDNPLRWRKRIKKKPRPEDGKKEQVPPSTGLGKKPPYHRGRGYI